MASYATVWATSKVVTLLVATRNSCVASYNDFNAGGSRQSYTLCDVRQNGQGFCGSHVEFLYYLKVVDLVHRVNKNIGPTVSHVGACTTVV